MNGKTMTADWFGIHDEEFPWWARILVSVAAGFAIYFAVYFIRDVATGEDRNYTATVIGKQFVPDRSHWETYIESYSCGTSRQPRWCSRTAIRYVRIPPEYHVFARDETGESFNFDDSWAFTWFVEKDACRLQSRVGGTTKHRYFTHILHEKPER